MSVHTLTAALASTTLIAGCVAMPTEPMVPAMVGSQKTIALFGADDAACRSAANQFMANGPVEGRQYVGLVDNAGWWSEVLQRQYDAAYAQCMYAHGHRVPAAFLQANPYAAPPYPPRDYPPPASAAPSEPAAPTAR